MSRVIYLRGKMDFTNPLLKNITVFLLNIKSKTLSMAYEAQDNLAHASLSNLISIYFLLCSPHESHLELLLVSLTEQILSHLSWNTLPHNLYPVVAITEFFSS